MTGGCFKCGTKENLLRDYPNRFEVLQTQSSAAASTLARDHSHSRGNG